jgi:anti-sigma regulatory factor (Ser/Thr protein kinase)
MAVQIIPAVRNVSLRMSLACDLSAVRPMTAVMRDFLREQGASEQEVQACELAMSEACNNAIRYAGPGGQGKVVGIEVSALPDRIDLRVEDNTPGFDWPEEAALPEPDSENGRGIYLIECLMDRVNYFRGRGRNYLIMQKHRHVDPGAIAAHQSEFHRRLSESENVVRDMAEELSFCYESLSAIFRCSADIGKSNDLGDFARRLLTDLAQITSADWFVLRLTRPGEERLEVFASSGARMELPPLSPRPAAAKAVELDAASAREDVWFDEFNHLR